MSGQFYDDTVAEVAAALQTDPTKGISEAEARARLERLGPNLIAEEEGPSRFAILKGQILSPVVGVLLVAAILTILLREWIDFGVILAIVVLNACVGFLQEYRAERSLQMLRKLASPKARVVRGGVAANVASASLVPGDLIELESGDLLPADARVVWASSLRSNESALTGESFPADKTSEPRAIPTLRSAIATDAYTWERASRGRGRAIVFGTGPDTELGKIVEARARRGARAHFAPEGPRAGGAPLIGGVRRGDRRGVRAWGSCAARSASAPRSPRAICSSRR